MRISYSAIKTYQLCPLKYRFESVDKIRTPPTKEQDFGSSIHDALRYAHTGPPEETPSLDDVLQRFDKRLNPGLYQDKDDFARVLQRGRRILTNYYNATFPIVGRQVADLEKTFSISLSESADEASHTVTGRIDRIDYVPAADLYEVIDYKTSWRMPAANLAADSLQLSIYEEAVRRLYAAERVVVSLYHLEHLKKQEANRQAESWPESRSTILDTVSKIQSEMFDPRPGPYCQSCFHQKLCPMWMHKFKNELGLNDSVTTERTPAAELAEHYISISRQAKELAAALEALKPQLHAAMDELSVEALFCSSGCITRRPLERVEYDTRLAADFLRASPSLSDVLSLTKSSVSKLTKTGALSAEQLAQLEQHKTVKVTRSLYVKLADEDDSEDSA